MKEYFIQGGVFMWPILGCSLWAFTLIIERFFFYYMTIGKFKAHSDLFTNAISKGSLESGAAVLRENNGLLSNLLLAPLEETLSGGTSNHMKTSQVEKGIEESLHDNLGVLDRHLNTIATIGGIQPLLGLLGTITGMMATFEVISELGTGNAKALSGGISEAMITTQAGLIAAVPIILGHNYLRNRLKFIVSRIHKVTTRVMREIEGNVTG